MSEMIERVARVLAKQDFSCSWEELASHYRDGYWGSAKAAIAAMREPTPEMTSGEGVHTNCHMCGGHAEGWRLMIDTALADPLPIHDRLTDDGLGSTPVED